MKSTKSTPLVVASRCDPQRNADVAIVPIARKLDRHDFLPILQAWWDSKSKGEANSRDEAYCQWLATQILRSAQNEKINCYVVKRKV